MLLPVLLPTSDPVLNAACRAAVSVVAPTLSPDDFGVACGIVDRAHGTVRWGGFQAEKPRYPASTVKLFYLAYARKLIADGKLKETPELLRAMRDMIVDSTNDATALVLDSITGTTGGPELPKAELAKWMDKRQAVNRWFTSMGYIGLNACQKPWNEGPYGRELQGYGEKMALRNMMSPLAGMRLISEIMLDRIVDPKACETMRTLLHRTPESPQVKGFVGAALPAGYEQWSKAGWTGTVRHDIAWIKAPDGRETVLAIFSEKHAADESLIPKIAKELIGAMSKFP